MRSALDIGARLHRVRLVTRTVFAIWVIGDERHMAVVGREAMQDMTVQDEGRPCQQGNLLILAVHRDAGPAASRGHVAYAQRRMRVVGLVDTHGEEQVVQAGIAIALGSDDVGVRASIDIDELARLFRIEACEGLLVLLDAVIGDIKTRAVHDGAGITASRPDAGTDRDVSVKGSGALCSDPETSSLLCNVDVAVKLHNVTNVSVVDRIQFVLLKDFEWFLGHDCFLLVKLFLLPNDRNTVTNDGTGNAVESIVGVAVSEHGLCLVL